MALEEPAASLDAPSVHECEAAPAPPDAADNEAVSATIGVLNALRRSAQAEQERKARGQVYMYAARAAEGAALAHLQMCFVPQDPGDTPEANRIDPEPAKADPDIWTPFCTHVRKAVLGGDLATCKRDSIGCFDRTRSAPRSRGSSAARSRGSANRQSARGGSKESARAGSKPGGRQADRATELRISRVVDKAEDRVRAQIAAVKAEKARVEAERLEREQEIEEQRAKEFARIEMDHARGPCFHDSDGHPVYITPPTAEELPLTQEVLTYEVKSPPELPQEPSQQLSRGSRASGAVAKTSLKEGSVGLSQGSVAAAPAAGRSRAGGRGRGSTRRSFSAPSSQAQQYRAFEGRQPPLTQTMTLRPGVMVECRGRKKEGPSLSHDQSRMTMREYEDLANGIIRRPERPSPPPQAPADLQEAEDPANPFEALNSAWSRADVQTAPLAPDPKLRQMQRQRSVGAQKGGALPGGPRQRVPLLGAARGVGRPQPPLGATMGHGLKCADRHQDSFFFPEFPSPAGGGGSPLSIPSPMSPASAASPRSSPRNALALRSSPRLPASPASLSRGAAPSSPARGSAPLLPASPASAASVSASSRPKTATQQRPSRAPSLPAKVVERRRDHAPRPLSASALFR